MYNFVYPQEFYSNVQKTLKVTFYRYISVQNLCYYMSFKNFNNAKRNVRVQKQKGLKIFSIEIEIFTK